MRWPSVTAAAVVVVAMAMSAPGAARAQPEPPPPAGEIEVLERAPAAFGPKIEIERIDVVGNDYTDGELIRGRLQVAPGDVLRVGDPRLRDARFHVLSLGFFRDVEVTLGKGSRRGRVILRVAVVEQGTFVLRNLFLGTSEATPWWAGIDLAERNVFGSGLQVAGTVAITAGSRVAPADVSLEEAGRQYAAALSVSDPSVYGSRFGIGGDLLWVESDEPFRVSGSFDDDSPEGFRNFRIRRIGGRARTSWELTPLSRLAMAYRFEVVDSEPPASPTRAGSDGVPAAVDLDILDGRSRVGTLAVRYERDTRPDPLLPNSGDRIELSLEVGGSLFASSYDFVTATARYRRWFSVAGPAHVLSFAAAGGVILGDAPRFDLFYVGDLNRLLRPRIAGLIVSTRPSPNVFGAAADEALVGELAGRAEVEYAYRLFRRSGLIFGGDVFISAGVFGLASRDQARVRDEGLLESLPVDLTFDAGLRLDTEIGIFELSVGNAVGRIQP